MKEQLKRNFWFKIAVLFIGLIFECINLVSLSDHSWANIWVHISEDMPNVAIFGLLTFVLEAIYSLSEKMAEAHNINAHLLKSINALSAEINFYANDVQIKQFIEMNEGHLGQILSGLHKEIREVLRSSPNGFVVVGHEYSVKAYYNVWHLLVEQQKIREKEKTRPLEVCIAHRSSIQIWLRPDMAPILGKHSEFARHGGKIQRILCGRGGEPSKDHIGVCGMMISHGVADVKYYDLDSASVPHFHAGFLFVAENNEAIMWKDDNDGTISESRFIVASLHPELDFAKTWSLLEEASVPISTSS